MVAVCGSTARSMINIFPGYGYQGLVGQGKHKSGILCGKFVFFFPLNEGDHGFIQGYIQGNRVIRGNGI